ncbi:MAG: DUF2141 domain-containing protein [Cyclobacteriaceae bacterium]|nr:DUF2141 domain-containing protein [Cyclobacteriaceae bacterium]
MDLPLNLLMSIMLLSGTGQQTDFKSSVIVDLTDLRSTAGKIMISIYNDPETFPDSEKMMEQRILTNIPGEKMRIIFQDIDPGTYAVAVMHDENRDEKMNFNLLGMPNHGYCFSNNVKPKFRKPTWKEAKFDVGEQTSSYSGGNEILNLRLIIKILITYCKYEECHQQICGGPDFYGTGLRCL